VKPAPFDIIRAGSVTDATRILREADGSARVIAGAQSLGPMLNLRLAQPRLLVDLTGIPEMTCVTDAADAVTIGACVTTAHIEDGGLPGSGLDHLSAVANRIAYRAVRNRGTIGGSLCHADPAADWVTVLCALGSECRIAGPRGIRTLTADRFVTGAYETALAADEILEAISVPRLSARGRFGYSKLCRKAGEFALAMSAVLNDPGQGQLRIVIGATKGRPIVLADTRQVLDGTGINEAALVRFLQQHGIIERAAQHQQLAAVTRAYGQTTQ
jgi:aerobic carbon-monoxide dehydrogenase medium subunit